MAPLLSADREVSIISSSTTLESSCPVNRDLRWDDKGVRVLTVDLVPGFRLVFCQR